MQGLVGHGHTSRFYSVLDAIGWSCTTLVKSCMPLNLPQQNDLTAALGLCMK